MRASAKISGETKKWFARIEVSSKSLIFDDPFAFTLSQEEKQELKADGFIHVRDVISRKDVEKALRCVNQVDLSRLPIANC